MLDQVFGYEIYEGKYRVQKTEAKFVRLLFEDVIDGKSLTSIANAFNQQGVRPRKNHAKWHHGTIAKMIRNPRYCGELGYPKIINQSQQESAIRSLESRTISKDRKEAKKRNQSSPLYNLLKCSSCDCNLCLYEKEHLAYWRCAQDAGHQRCKSVHAWSGIADDDICAVILETINEMINDPDMIENQGQFRANLLGIVKVENEIKKRMQRSDEDTAEIEALLIEKNRLSYAQYDADYIAETERLKERVKKLPRQNELTKEIVQALIKEIRIDQEGQVIIHLLNHQSIEKRVTVMRKNAYA